MLNNYDQIAVGSNQVIEALAALQNRFQHKPFTPIASDLRASLAQRDAAYQAVLKTTAAASSKMAPDRQQYFYEHVVFPLLVDYRQTTAAIKLIQASAEQDDTVV